MIAAVQVPHHALDVVVMLDDVGVQAVREALVHDVVDQGAVVRLDLADLAAHAAEDLHSVLLGLPALLAGEMQEQIAVFVPCVKILVTRERIDGDVHLVEFQSPTPLLEKRLKAHAEIISQSAIALAPTQGDSCFR